MTHPEQIKSTLTKGNNMKKIIESVEGEGLESLLGEEVQIWCDCYIYSGILEGVNTHDILLKDAKVVYETGNLDEAGFSDMQSMPHKWYVRISKIESYGPVVK